LAHPQGRWTRVAGPSTQTASPAPAHLHQQRAQVIRVATKVPPGWQKPRAARAPSSRSGLSPTSVLQAPDRPGGAPVRQPVQQHGSDRDQADLQRQWWGAALPGRARGPAGGRGDRPARPARVRTARSAGSMPTGTRPHMQASRTRLWSGPRQRPGITDTHISRSRGRSKTWRARVAATWASARSAPQPAHCSGACTTTSSAWPAMARYAPGAPGCLPGRRPCRRAGHGAGAYASRPMTAASTSWRRRGRAGAPARPPVPRAWPWPPQAR
jgi:hypothetical protein